jgi:predicted transposase YbfD/YdcC
MAKRSRERKDVFKTIVDLYESIPEPRVHGRCKHKLVDILVIITCSYLVGINDWEEVELYANEKIDWFKQYLELPSGIPSHDTFSRVFKLIDAKAFELVFFSWIQSVIELKEDQVIAFDGKRVSGTYPMSASSKGQALSLLNIWAVDNNITLGQLKISVTGFPESLGIKECIDYIDIKGMIVTADAASSYPSLGEAIISRGGNYLLPVKRSNRPQAKALDAICKLDLKREIYKRSDKKRGREELRVFETINDKKVIDNFCKTFKWPGLKVIGICYYTRKEKDRRIGVHEAQKDGSWKWTKNNADFRELSEKKFYLSSKDLSAKELAEKARSHWHVENKLNWHLDVTFGEDNNRTRDRVAAENMAMVRKICINLLNAETSFKKSLKLKKRKCQINDSYLEKVLFAKHS